MVEPFKIHFRSLGCKVNLADLAQLVARLPAGQFHIAREILGADIVLLNTCTVTHKADRNARKILGALLRDHPEVPVLVTGCGAVSMTAALANFENVRKVIPPGEPGTLAGEILALSGTSRSPGTSGAAMGEASPFFRLGRRRAVVKVQDGCNAGCAYCLLPRVRGRERSVPPERVIEAVNRSSGCGHREIVLSGIHLGRYGRGLGRGTNLAALIEKLGPLYARLGPGYRLRLSSIEPLEWTKDLLAVVSVSPFVCRHFHIPLQSGDDDVLARMRRPYRREQFQDLIERLRCQIPAASIGSDVMSGFPGESDTEAEHTQEFLGKLQLDYLHVFTFSARPGTAAKSLPGRVPAKIVASRASALRSMGHASWRRFVSRAIGKRLRVLLEDAKDGWLRGHSDAYRPVKVPAGEDAPGEMIELVAKNLDEDRLVGVSCKPDMQTNQYERGR
ncbi:MAG TPA: MiaB/RimO family radical SAM methylthiotransferase [Myxococcota bacterium]|nr:MiaB/RimO family radical SAM methylthiotransferase [Myxococcota bacterium]